MSGAVAVTAASVLNTVAEDLDGFTAALRVGRSGVGSAGDRLPASTRVAVGAWLPHPSLHEWARRHLADDPAATGRLVTAAGRSAPTAQLAACVAAAAVRAAGLSLAKLEETALIVAGNNLATAYQAATAVAFAQDERSVRPSYALSGLDTDAIGTISQATGIRAEGSQVGGASASSALAVIAAARLVAEGHAQRCLVVAPHCELSPAEFRALHDSGAMAHHAFLDQPHRVCRPFDQDRQGFVYGQGAAAVLLERTGPGIEPLALILGHGQRLDGRRGTEPNPAGQAAAIRAALLAARLRPGEVDYVNTHGTGSPAGDVSEAKAVYEVFGSGPWINSTKPLLGHCMGAAGLQELIATILQLRHGFVHPNPNLELPLDIPLRFAGHTASAARIRVAVSNSFAFSGINASIVVGEI